jgi:hypothetical protein
MGCSSCNQNGPKAMFGGIRKATKAIGNIATAAKQQPNKFKWFRDGVTGLAKCVGHQSKYSDQDIKINRDACRNCEHSTKQDGKLTSMSQCMAPDPERGGAPCGCFVMCKTQSGDCPLKVWKTTPITLNGNNV